MPSQTTEQSNPVNIMPSQKNTNTRKPWIIAAIIGGGCCGLIILSILFSVLVAGISIAQRGSRDNIRTKDLLNIKSSIESCYSKTGKIPSNIPVSQGESLDICDETINVSQKSIANSADVRYSDSGSLICGDKATAAIWYLGYRKISNDYYILCTTLENGQIYDLSVK